ncbi:SEC14-like protein 2 [Acanthaster planci]|uniref:SEC14-like protein 2 n=1 Tax=Acanthaster planci TaxID=133434 RepID=A0A8B8A0Y4_ACAPL|nr:SEC14-like protein 2 [Acanthaster planci]XP_022109498.1 SEC14-like protein 2 [Acanthaster planci]
MNGLIPQLTTEQLHKLHQFRSAVSDILKPEHDDHYLLRWLRARKFDLKKSEKMLRDHFEFRKRWDVDYIANQWKPPEVLDKFFVGGLFGEDREGSPVWFDPYGHIDTKGIVMSVARQDFLRFKILACERIQQALREQSKKHGRRIEMYTLVFDLDRVNFSHLWRPFVNLYNEVIKIWEANYPESLKVVLVINTPKMFSVGFNLIKPFLSEETAAKAVIVDSHYHEALFNMISKENVPIHYGGTAVDSDNDPKCRSKICFGGKVPKSYYLNDQFNFDNMSQVWVPSGTVWDLKYQVTVPGSVLKWEFKTEKCNIGYGVFLQVASRPKQDDHKRGHGKARNHSSSSTSSASSSSSSSSRDGCYDLIEMRPLEKVHSEMVPEAGGLRCEEPGTYILRFDNTYSWLRGKRVFYSVEVMLPAEELTIDKNPP